MKKIYPLILASVALAWSLQAEAQHTLSKPDSVLLSETKSSTETVRNYRVTTPMEADYAMHYAISSAQLNKTMGDNPEELEELTQLMNRLKDSLNRVDAIHIMGYASPDGPAQLNGSLANQRATNFKHYVVKQYALPEGCRVVLGGEIAPWSAVREKLAQSSVAGRDEALKILDGNHTPAEKQAALKQMPAVWQFLAREALPPLRRVEVDVKYRESQLVETRTKLAPKPAPQPQPTPEAVVVLVEEEVVPSKEDPCCDELLMSETLGIIVAMPGSEVDF